MNSREKLLQIAVALHYDGSTTPRVTAKGHDRLAEMIKSLAQDHGVPLYHDPVLAQVLSHVELGEEIPPELFRAVAEVISFAYLLAGRTPDSVK